jgi:hypothetical protein
MDLEMALNDLAAHIHPASLAPWYQQCAWYLAQRDALARAQDDQAAAGDEPGPGGGPSGDRTAETERLAEQRRVALAEMRQRERLEGGVTQPTSTAKLLLRLYGLDQALIYN